MTLRLICIALLGGVLLLSACAPVDKQENPEAHYTLGISYMRAGDPTMALKELLVAEQIDPESAKTQAALGEVYMLKKAYAEAERHLKQALQLDPGNPGIQNNLAALYLKMERYDAAIEYFRLAATNYLFSSPEVSWTGLGYAQMKKERYADALESFDKAISANWRYAEAYLRRGETFFALGEIDKAKEEYLHALEDGMIAPLATTSLAHYDLGLAFLKQRNTEQAISHFNSVLELAPQSELGRQAKTFLNVLK